MRLIVCETSDSMIRFMVSSVFVDGYLNAAEEMKVQEIVPSKLSIPRIHDEPENKLRARIIDTVSNTEFDLCIAFFIISNIVLMGFESYKQAQWQTEVSTWAGVFFTLIFGWECLFKMYAFGCKRYFESGWNKFDYFIVVLRFEKHFLA